MATTVVVTVPGAVASINVRIAPVADGLAVDLTCIASTAETIDNPDCTDGDLTCWGIGDPVGDESRELSLAGIGWNNTADAELAIAAAARARELRALAREERATA